MAHGSSLSSTQYLHYPPSIGDTLKHWVSFQAFDFRSHNETLNIALYIPPDALSTSYKSDYEAETLGQIQGRAVEAYRESGGNVEQIAKASEAKGAAAKSVVTDLTMLLATPEKYRKAMEITKGMVANPYIVAAYKGPTQMREHSFSFKMMPEDVGESRKCVAIASAFKQAMLPAHAGGDNATAPTGLFGYPDEFEISFVVDGNPLPKNENNPMFNIGKSVLTNCDLSYTTQDTVVFFEGTQFPVTINMKLTFMEIEVMYRTKITHKGL